MDSQIDTQKRYSGIQLGKVVCDMLHWSWIPRAPRGPPRGEARSARQKPEEARVPEGQGRINEERVDLPPEH
jgi:hypothetical protein